MVWLFSPTLFLLIEIQSTIFLVNMSLAKTRVAKKKQKVLRNVLVVSAKIHWSTASDHESLLINNKLKLCLAPVKINIPRLPWHLRRTLSKEERKIKQDELLNLQSPEVKESYNKALKLRKYLFLGVNALCKGIEHKKVTSCILDADVSPKMLVTHVAELAKNASVPVLSVHNLKGTLNSILGFPSLALGFEKSIELDKSNIFHEICSHIIETTNLLEKSEKQIIKEDMCTLQSTTSFFKNEKDKKELIDRNTKENIVTPPVDSQNVSDNQIHSVNVSDNQIHSVNVIDNQIHTENVNQNVSDLLQNIYLYRNSEEIRVFKPLINELPSYSIIDNEELSNDCIQLTTDNLPDEINKTVSTTNSRYFKPLIVKRIQSNPNKKKKKNKK